MSVRSSRTSSSSAPRWWPSLDSLLPTRLSIGIAVGEHSVRIVGTERGEVCWATEGDLDPGEPLERAIPALLAGVELPHWPRPRVVAAVGPSRAQTKPLDGLPALEDLVIASRLVAEGSDRFFLRNGVPLVISSVASGADESLWAAAFERPVVEGLLAGCRAAGLRLEAIVPAAAVLPLALGDAVHGWRDGTLTLDVVAREGRLLALHRSPAPRLTPGGADGGSTRVAAAVPRSDTGASHVVPALAVLDSAAARFADAYGASVAPRSLAPALRLTGRGTVSADSRNVSRGRLTLAIAAALLALAAAAVAPVVRAVFAERHAAAELARLAPERAAAIHVMRDLDAASAALNEAESFTRSALAPTRFLAELAGALPAGTALVSLRADSAGATLVAVGARVSGLAAALERVEGLTGAEPVGATTRERTATGQELERGTFRVRWTAAPRRDFTQRMTPVTSPEAGARRE